MIVILWLLVGFTSWSQNVNDSIPSTGKVMLSNTTNTANINYFEKNDSSFVIMPIDIIKQANIKLIERKYLLNLTAEQDSIINLKDSYIFEQNVIINNLQFNLQHANELNKNINNELNSQIKKTRILGGVVGGLITSIIIGIIIK